MAPTNDEQEEFRVVMALVDKTCCCVRRDSHSSSKSFVSLLRTAWCRCCFPSF